MGLWKNRFNSKSPLKQPEPPKDPPKDPPPKSLNISKEDFIKKVRQSGSMVGSEVSATALKNQVDFLNHPFYQENAKNVWGENAELNTQKQIDRMKASRINKSDIDTGVAGRFSFNKGIFKDSNVGEREITIKPDREGDGELHSTEHELGHASDVINESTVTAYNDPERMRTEDESYDEFLSKDRQLINKLAPEFSGYEKLRLKNPYFGTTGQNKDYLKNPSEFRTRLSHTKKLMTLDNFNWNKKSGEEINTYIQNKLQDENLGESAKRELQQFSEYNVERTKPTYIDWSEDYNKYATDKKYRKKWNMGRKVMSFEDWTNSKGLYDEDKKSMMEDRDGDGKPDMKMELPTHSWDKEQNKKFIEHVFKELAQENTSSGSLLNKTTRYNRKNNTT